MTNRRTAVGVSFRSTRDFLCAHLHKHKFMKLIPESQDRLQICALLYNNHISAHIYKSYKKLLRGPGPFGMTIENNK